jgi:hypothetical protein
MVQLLTVSRLVRQTLVTVRVIAAWQVVWTAEILLLFSWEEVSIINMFLDQSCPS